MRLRWNAKTAVVGGVLSAVLLVIVLGPMLGVAAITFLTIGLLVGTGWRRRSGEATPYVGAFGAGAVAVGSIATVWMALSLTATTSTEASGSEGDTFETPPTSTPVAE